MNNLQDLFNDVIEDEAEEDDLDPQNKVVPTIHVAQELAFCHDDSFFRHELIWIGSTFTGLKSVRTISPPVGGISKAICTNMYKLRMILLEMFCELSPML